MLFCQFCKAYVRSILNLRRRAAPERLRQAILLLLHPLYRRSYYPDRVSLNFCPAFCLDACLIVRFHRLRLASTPGDLEMMIFQVL